MHSKYGEVMSLRLPPEDIMACIDIIKKLGIYTDGMSLSAAVRIGISAAMESLRRSQVLPTHDGFDYIEVVRPFAQTNRSKKAQFSQALNAADVSLQVADAPRATFELKSAQEPTRSAGAEDLFDELVKRKGRLLTRVEEMRFKMKADPLNFGKEEQLELDNIEQQVRELDGKLEELA